MAVNPNEIFIHATGKEVASTLIGIAELQGFNWAHVRSQEGGFAVPASVAEAFHGKQCVVPEPVVVTEKPSHVSKAEYWDSERRALQAEKMREYHRRRREAKAGG